MFIYMFIFTTLILSSYTFLMYYFYSKTLKYKNGEVLLVKIPYGNKDDAEVFEIVKKARKMLKIVSIVQLILIVFLNLFMLYLQMVYILAFFIVILVPTVVEVLYLNSQRKKLVLLKSEKGWNSQTDVFIDTKLLNSNLKSRYNKICIYALLIFVIFIILDIFFLKTEFIVAMIVGVPIPLILLFFIVMKSENYIYISEDFEENYNYNFNKINENISLFKQMVIANIVSVIIQILGINILVNKLGIFSNFILMVILLSVFVMIYYIIKYNKINKKYEVNKNSIADSGDFYDYISYDNPYDNRVFVADKIFLGMSINRGTPKGKLVFIANYLIGAILIIGAVYFVMLIETKDYTYTVNKDILEIDAGEFDSKIDLNDVKNIELKEFEEFPDATRSIGAASNKKSYGKWRVEGYGKVNLYKNNDVDLYIIIKTKDKTYILNDNTKDSTKKLYDDILNTINK
ncbi:PH domain-containing protein [Miniphocaeibacter massiliensis]|uniref:PH domain-containing protein n=1 Tax=Miniphocaeibacter massiliensis TaxID=2041841 RepID=UPI000C07ECFF|nr:PH domain-containing protein [Miniphocaeibacter massiliensis]